jgi:hypothetical protein
MITYCQQSFSGCIKDVNFKMGAGLVYKHLFNSFFRFSVIESMNLSLQQNLNDIKLLAKCMKHLFQQYQFEN